MARLGMRWVQNILVQNMCNCMGDMGTGLVAGGEYKHSYICQMLCMECNSVESVMLVGRHRF